MFMFSERLKSLRIDNTMSQVELAKKVGLSQQTIGHYEKGRAHPDTKMLCKFADLFDCTTDYLLGRSNNRSEPNATEIDLEELFNDKVLFRGKTLDRQAKEDLIKILEILLRKTSSDKNDEIL